jgi:hypothetical protein
MNHKIFFTAIAFYTALFSFTACKKCNTMPAQCKNVMCTEHIEVIRIKVQAMNLPVETPSIELKKPGELNFKTVQADANGEFAIASDVDDIKFEEEKTFKVRVLVSGTVQAEQDYIITHDCCHVLIKSGPKVLQF